jgi:hypothetical protein
MNTGLVTAIIGGCSVMAGVLLKHILDREHRKRQLEAIKERDQKLKECQDKCDELLGKLTDQCKRRISYQLQILEEKIADLFVPGQTPEVSILGINALGPLHQGLEILRSFLDKGGVLRILLLNPETDAFNERSDRERDEAGRLRAELLTSFYVIMDLMKKVPAGRMEVRLHAEYPDKSLLMINSKEEDGIIMENPYPDADLREKRGLEGEMYELRRAGATGSGYRSALEYFSRLWDGADEIEVVQKESTQIREWPFVLKASRKAQEN